MNKHPKGSSQWKHRLSNIKERGRTADCLECGEGMPIQKRGFDRLGVLRWRCRKGATERTRLWKRWKRRERNRILSKQCQICGTDDNLCYDHNHNNGEYRGTLCKRCNSAIGLLDENILHLKRAIKYLEVTSGKGIKH